jgi:hypothetical protein
MCGWLLQSQEENKDRRAQVVEPLQYQEKDRSKNRDIAQEKDDTTTKDRTQKKNRINKYSL